MTNSVCPLRLASGDGPAQCVCLGEGCAWWCVVTAVQGVPVTDHKGECVARLLIKVLAR